jgi:dinuclear metal center YbgI/SA1388 family protein
MKINEFISFLKQQFPENLQEKYDNSGVQILQGNFELSGVLLSLDLNYDTIEIAKSSGSNLICTHHPLLFNPLKKIDISDSKQQLVVDLIQNNISLYALHTNLDKVFCKKSAEKIGLKNISLIYPENDDETIGYGNYGSLDTGLKFRDFLKKVSSDFDTEYLLYSGRLTKEIKKVALLNGSGGSHIFSLIKDDYDCIITGDVKYHEAFDASLYDVCIIDAGHFWTEIYFMNLLKDEIEQFSLINNLKLNITLNKTEKNPLRLYVPGEKDE